MEKVYLASDDRGIQETTSRTVSSTFYGRFCVKKVNQESDGQENKKECQIERFIPFIFHIINYNLLENIILLMAIYFKKYDLRCQAIVFVHYISDTNSSMFYAL